MQRNALILGMILLLLGSIVSPLSMGNQSVLNETPDANNQYTYSTVSPYDCYDVSEIPAGYNDISTTLNIVEKNVKSSKISTPPPSQKLDLLNSSWPMYCHDTRHTGRSPFSTINTWDEIWRFRQDKNDYIRCSPVIAEDGTIYFGGLADFYALYPNGTMKWKYEGLSGYVWSAPAIDANGTIYCGDVYGGYGCNIYSLNPNGTLKWKYHNGNNVFSSPAIDNNGIIYFGDENDYIYALWPNGTLRWRYKTGHVVYSSPAIGDDGTIYCGSHDTYLYALYPDNGSLKWRYKTGNWIRTSPCIADDGTIYCVSLDDHLYAIHPNGTLKWKTDMGEGGTSPTIGQDGTIYAGYAHLRAFYPINGSIKWTLPLGSGRRIRGATPCHSVEDIIIFGTHIGDYGGGEIIAVNPDGTERWRKKIANEYVDSAPAIGADGTVYIGSSLNDHGSNYGFLYAFGMANLTAHANGPYHGLTQEPVDFQGSARGGYWPHTYHWEFGDGNTSYEQNPLHSYSQPGNYTIMLTVTDNISNTSADFTWAWIQDGNNPPSIPIIDGKVKGNPEVTYEYTFESSDPENLKIWYYVDWGDGTNSGWLGPYPSGTIIYESHSWDEQDTLTIRCKTKDVYDDESDWGLWEIQIPKSYHYPGWQWLQNTFPTLSRLLNILGGLL